MNELEKLAQKQGVLGRFTRFFKERKRILVLGSPGVGKTSLVQTLTKGLENSFKKLDRTEHVVSHELATKNSILHVLDTPGGLARQKAFDQVSGKSIGVINVVSYGYHETSERPPRFKDGIPDPKFLAFKREQEIIELDTWANTLGFRTSLEWVMTVVTKADLWWSFRREVLRHYERGEYAASLPIGKNFHTFVTPHCSVFKKFYGKGFVDSSFDESLRRNLFDGLVMQLISAIEFGDISVSQQPNELRRRAVDILTNVLSKTKRLEVSFKYDYPHLDCRNSFLEIADDYLKTYPSTISGLNTLTSESAGTPLYGQLKKVEEALRPMEDVNESLAKLTEPKTNLCRGEIRDLTSTLSATLEDVVSELKVVRQPLVEVVDR